MPIADTAIANTADPPVSFAPPKRQISRIFIHCSASDDPKLSGSELVAEIDRWHRARGFAGVGYHFLIDKAGVLFDGRGLERVPAAQAGHNKGTIAICVHGLEDFTPASLATLRSLCWAINAAYGGTVTFHGHREVNPHKTCPVFDYRALLGLDQAGHMAANDR